MSIFGFPGGETGKRWHRMRRVDKLGEDKDNYRIYSSTYLTSMCGTWIGVYAESYDRFRDGKEPRQYDDILIESENPPFPYCHHCRRVDGSVVSG